MSDEDAALAANDAFYTAFNEKDIHSMGVLWAREAPVTCIHPHGNLIHGRQQVMATWYAILGNQQQPKIVSGGAIVHVSGDVASVICRELVSGIGVVATNLFVREAGHWRMCHHHASPVALQDS